MAGTKKGGRRFVLDALTVRNAGDGDHGDGGGLLLRIRGEYASWVYRFTSPSGKRREMGLGAAPRSSVKLAGASLTEAREAVEKARKQVRDGLDPIDERDAERAREATAAAAKRNDAQRLQRTLAWCARDYHARVIEPKRTTKHGLQWIASLENHVPAALWRMPIDQVTPPALLAGLLEIKPHERARNVAAGARLHVTVGRVRQRLDAVFADAVFHGWATVNAAAAIKAKLREAMPEHSAGNFAALPYTEAPELMRRLRAMPGTGARTLELAMLTASRTREVLGARWDEIDDRAATWTVPGDRMKGGEPHTVSLSRQAVAVIRAQSGVDPALLFPSTHPTRAHLPQSGGAMQAVLNRLGVRDRTTVHGLCRATFSTWANDAHAAREDVIEAALAHTEEDRVRRAYDRAEHVAARRALLQAWADFLDGVPEDANQSPGE